MSSGNQSSGAPTGTTYTVMCENIKRNDWDKFISTIKSLEWGEILGTRAIDDTSSKLRMHMIIYFGKQNHNMSAVFQHLEYGGEVKVNNDNGFWILKLICWVSQPANIPQIEENPKFSFIPLNRWAPRWVDCWRRAACGIFKN